MTRLPYSVKRGESFPLNVSVFNYIDVSHIGKQRNKQRHQMVITCSQGFFHICRLNFPSKSGSGTKLAISSCLKMFTSSASKQTTTK